MFKKIPMLGLFMFLACVVALLPAACSSSDNGSNDAAPDTMTSS
jgi:hypothetical protein